MTVTLTEKAAFRLRTFIKSSSKTGVRLAVITGGCSGYEYSLNITNEPESNDLVFEQDRIPIYVDSQSAPLLEGVLVDFVESLTQSGFVFTNPNATDSCGCGKSFSTADCSGSVSSCK